LANHWSAYWFRPTAWRVWARNRIADCTACGWPIIPCVLRRFVTMPPGSAQNYATQAINAADFHQTGSVMSNIRTANKRHKRAIVANIARNKATETPAIAPVEPVQAAS
jgi:hypothetical protein